jgi:hypothetical protein
MSTRDELSFSLKSGLIAARPRELRLTWQVAGAMAFRDVPGLDGGQGPLARTLGYVGRPRRLPSPSGEIWGVSLMRDEVDVAAYTVEHLLAEGVDRVLVADNGSVDGTGDLLRELGRTHPVAVIDDDLTAYHQGVKMTRLARAAVRAGAAWVVPFDADEMWYSLAGGTLAEALRGTDCDIAVADMWNHLPDADSDDATEPNPYLRMRHRTSDTIGVVKVAFRAHPWARLVPGNHNVRRPGRRAKILGIRQVPWRSPEQVERKHRNGVQALDAGGLEFAEHWRELGTLPSDEMVARVYDDASDTAVTLDPAPYRSLA